MRPFAGSTTCGRMGTARPRRRRPGNAERRNRPAAICLSPLELSPKQPVQNLSCAAMLGVMNPVTQVLQGKFAVPGPWLDLRNRRLWATAEARSIGRGGVSRVAETTGMSRGTVRAGLKEFDSGEPTAHAPKGSARLGSPGGGRKALRHYAYRERAIGRELSGAIETPRKYRLSTVPRSVSSDQVRRMLEGVDRRAAVGNCDYAILLLLVIYGLRAREASDQNSFVESTCLSPGRNCTLSMCATQRRVCRLPGERCGVVRQSVASPDQVI